MTTQLFDSLTLPNGSLLPNRIAKAAMEENMAGPGQAPDEQLFALYRRWAAGGAGLLISGNVMVDRRALTGPGGVVLENDTPLDSFRRWAEAGKQHGAPVLVANQPSGTCCAGGDGRQCLGPFGGRAQSGQALETLWPADGR
jgi:2,4-dienoyl-CoA reductase-like NADH-dependent reductase (Old Yellow Enzyme family)